MCRSVLFELRAVHDVENRVRRLVVASVAKIRIRTVLGHKVELAILLMNAHPCHTAVIVLDVRFIKDLDDLAVAIGPYLALKRLSLLVHPAVHIRISNLGVVDHEQFVHAIAVKVHKIGHTQAGRQIVGAAPFG